ncbi:MAG: DUF429 domain-containing protein [Herminiimonas sp.]|nr:DUF429 domain-containing protein [Herminiimonas sp.]
MRLFGIDFTSAPTRRKSITIAGGVLAGDTFILHTLSHLHDFDTFERWLRLPGPWLGVFDLPFSLPRELVETLGWPTCWPELIAHVAAQTRPQLRESFKGFCAARAVGNKFAHRATDLPAGSSSSMKWVNPPVAYMLHAGVPRIVAAGVTVFGMQAGDPSRIALEGYPGMVARSIVRTSYKNDDLRKQTSARRDARAVILAALQAGDYPLGIRLDAGTHLPALLEDGSGDLLDAVLCGVLAAWAWQRRDTQFGLPVFDPLEGWIVGA